jgi:hypothetical protein
MKHIIYFNSKDEKDKSSSSSVLNLVMNPVINIKKNKKGNINVSLLNFTFNNFIPNISETLQNNEIRYKPKDDIDFTIIKIDEGKYSVDDIESFSIGPKILQFKIEYSPILNRTVLIFLNDCELDFRHGSIFELLGFESAIYKRVSPTKNITFSKFPPNLNQITNIFICSNLVTNEISFNGRQSSILDSLPLDEDIKKINYSPSNPNKIICKSPKSIKNISFYLSDQNNNILNINDAWTAKILITDQ